MSIGTVSFGADGIVEYGFFVVEVIDDLVFFDDDCDGDEVAGCCDCSAALA